MNLDAIMQPALEKVAPAITLRVYHQNQVLIQGAWGCDLDTWFDLASLTKLFTTTAFLSLVSEKQLSLKTPLAEIIPEFGGLRAIDGGQDPHTKEYLPTPEHLAGQTVDAKTVTFWHLLTHTSGLPPWRDVFSIAEPDDPLSASERWERGLKRWVEYPFVDRVGSKVAYSDIGVMLLGEAIRRLSERSTLQEVIEERVIKPLGLKNICFNPLQNGIPKEKIAPTELDSKWRKRRVWGEVHDENAFGLGGVAGHAGLFGIVETVAKFGLAWLDGKQLGIDPDLRMQAISEQAESGGERRGLGWMLPSFEKSSAGDLMSRSAFGHTGFTGTSLWIDPTRDLVVALLTNRVYFGRKNLAILPFRRQVHDAIVEGLR